MFNLLTKSKPSIHKGINRVVTCPDYPLNGQIIYQPQEAEYKLNCIWFVAENVEAFPGFLEIIFSKSNNLLFIGHATVPAVPPLASTVPCCGFAGANDVAAASDGEYCTFSIPDVFWESPVGIGWFNPTGSVFISRIVLTIEYR